MIRIGAGIDYIAYGLRRDLLDGGDANRIRAFEAEPESTTTTPSDPT